MHANQVISPSSLDSLSTSSVSSELNEDSSANITQREIQVENKELADASILVPPVIDLLNCHVLASKYKSNGNLNSNKEVQQFPRKTGRIRKGLTSPKSTKEQISDSLQQANLNGFIQIKHEVKVIQNEDNNTGFEVKTKEKVSKREERENDANNSSFKVSATLFMSPKGKRPITRLKSENNLCSKNMNEFLTTLKVDLLNENSQAIEKFNMKENIPDAINLEENLLDKTEEVKALQDKIPPILKSNAFHFLMDQTRLTPPEKAISPKIDLNIKKRKIDFEEDTKRSKLKKSMKNVSRISAMDIFEDGEEFNMESKTLTRNTKKLKSIKPVKSILKLAKRSKSVGDYCDINFSEQIKDSKNPEFIIEDLDDLKDIRDDKLNNFIQVDCDIDKAGEKGDSALITINEKSTEIDTRKVSPLKLKGTVKTLPVGKFCLSLRKSPVNLNDATQRHEDKDTVEIEEDEAPNLRRSTRIRKSVLASPLFLDLDVKKGKSQRKRFTSESSVDSVESSSSTTSAASSKSGKKRGRKANSLIDKKGNKVASIFEKAKPKPKLSPASLVARESFLRSGVPNSIKQKHLKLDARLEENFVIFPAVAHVQQRCSSFVWTLSSLKTALIKDDDFVYCNNVLPSTGSICLTWGIIDNYADQKVEFIPPSKGCSLYDKFTEIVNERPNDPVRHLFVSFGDRNGYNYRPKKLYSRQKLKSSLSTNIIKGNPVVVNKNLNQHTMWTQKYRPKSSLDLIGNADVVKELRKWLQSWLDIVDKPGGEMFDLDGADTLKNMIILYGKPGCGKSATVYALCEEMGINVLEVNVSSRRTGKQLLQQMHEATQSHQVRKHNEMDVKMCLLLIDDADLVYQQDDNFTRDLQTIITTSKRPVVLTTNDYSVSHIFKYVNQLYPVLSFGGVSARSMATYLQILCLMEGVTVSRKAIGSLLEWNLGDLRRTILHLQFWIAPGGDSKKELTLNANGLHERCIQTFIAHSREQILPKPIDLGGLWWNLPNIAGIKTSLDEKERQTTDKGVKNTKTFLISQELNKLKKYAKYSEVISFCDNLNRTEGILGSTEPHSCKYELHDTVELNLRTDYFKTDRYLTEELEQILLEGHSRKFVSEENHLNKISEQWLYAAPVKIRRWRRNQENCTLEFQRAVPIQVRHNKSNFHEDYFPYLRELARTDEHRRENNPKRGKRDSLLLSSVGIYDVTSFGFKTACKILKVDDCHYA